METKDFIYQKIWETRVENSSVSFVGFSMFCLFLYSEPVAPAPWRPHLLRSAHVHEDVNYSTKKNYIFLPVVKGAQARDVRLQGFYTNQTRMGRWLMSLAKKFKILIA